MILLAKKLISIPFFRLNISLSKFPLLWIHNRRTRITCLFTNLSTSACYTIKSYDTETQVHYSSSFVVLQAMTLHIPEMFCYRGDCAVYNNKRQISYWLQICNGEGWLDRTSNDCKTIIKSFGNLQ